MPASRFFNRRNPWIRFSFFACFSLSVTLALAQWPTTYTAPKILTSGDNIRAGNVLADAAGGVFVAYDSIQSNQNTLWGGHYDIAGQQLFTNIEFDPMKRFRVWVKLFTMSAPDTIAVASKLAVETPGSTDNIFRYNSIDQQGHFDTDTGSNILPFDVVFDSNEKRAMFGEVRTSPNFSIFHLMPNIRDLPEATHIGEAELLVFPNDNILACYTVVDNQPEPPGELWSVMTFNTGNLGLPEKVEDAASIDHIKPHLVSLDDTTAMAAWLGELDHGYTLYASIYNDLGEQVSAPHKCYENVIDYVVTSSTLGLPVFAAVTRTSEFPPQEALVGGLLNPANGGTLTIPVAAVAGVKVKALRQEANGDFSLLYSVPENGTNLLKVRRISGVTGGTLWETTVADLGWASDAIIERYGNTWVTGNNDNVLYILARYDEPNTASSSFQLVRVRADGTMGGD